MWQKLQKFGLGHCDLPTMLSNVSVMLRVLTLNIDSTYTKRIPIIFYILTLWALTCCQYIYLISISWFVFVRSWEADNLVEVMQVASLGIASQIGPIKLCYLFLYKDYLKQLVDGYRECDAYVIPGTRFEVNLLQNLRVVKKRAIIFWSTIMFNSIIYTIKPLFLSGRHFLDDLVVIYGLEPMFESPHYEIAYISMTASVSIVCYAIANFSALLIIIAGYTEAQMLALAEESENIWKDAKNYCINMRLVSDSTLECHDDKNMEFNKEKVMNEYVKQQLERIIKCHTRQLNLLGQVEHVFRGALVIEFMLVTLGLIIELLGGLENTYQVSVYSTVLLAINCLVGQRLMDASIAFENSVYNCKWENFDKSNMKMVLLMLQNAQRTMKLTAGSMIILNFPSLMYFIRSIYSAYTTLRTTMH